jgi:hypothetical protein
MSSRSAPVTLSVTGRLLRTPRVAWAVLIVAGGLLFAIATVSAAVRMKRVALPGVGLEGLEVVASQRPELQPGDRLLAVDGVRGRAAQLVDEIIAGGRVTLTFRDAGDIVAATAPLDDVHRAAMWVRVICAVACLIVGAVSFVLAPGIRAAWLFLLFCVTLEVTLGFNVLLVRDLAWFARLEPITFALGASLALHLFSELPRRLPLIERRPWAALLAYLPAAPIVIAAAIRPTTLLALAGAVWSLVGGCLSVAILVAGMRRAQREADEPLESRYRTMLLALSVGLFLPALVHTARSITGVGQERWIIHLNAVPVVAYPLATGWALLRHNVLGADRITTVVVSYAATVVLLALGCGLALVAVPLFFRGELSSSPLALVVLTAMASLSIVPVYRRLKSAIDRRFQRDRASEERVTHELAELMRVALGGDRARTMQAAFKALKVLTPERVELWLREPGGGAFHSRGSDGTVPGHGPERAPVKVGSALGREMLAEKTGGVEGLAPTTLAPEAQAELWERDLAVAAPVTVQGEVRAFVGLGRRSSGGRFGAGEQSFLTMVAAQLGLALERGQEGTSIGRYRLERRLGTGGMAEVYLARQSGLAGFERRVAIKRPLPHLAEDAGFIAMLIDEAKLAAHLHHPHIVQTYEVDRQAGTYYIAMEYVEGASLRTLLRALRAVAALPPLPVVARLAEALLGALAYAHEALDARGRRLGIVHRDVTPGNVLVGVNGEVKLVDFGVARGAGRMQVTQTGVVKGTLAYMAPEQAHGGEVDARSDLFGAAALLSECLCGEPPYPDGPPKTAPATELAFARPIAPPLAAVLRRALAFRPEDRHATAAELRDAFLAACGVAPATIEELAAWQGEAMQHVPRDADVALEEARTETVRMG